MRRLDKPLLDRCRKFGHRMIDVGETLERSRRSRRIVDQVIGCGTSVGANMYEADEALSRADFCTAVGRSLKEVSESEFWIDLVGERNWVRPTRLLDLKAEALALRRMFGAMIARTRTTDASRKRRPNRDAD
ncbi:MAG: four helix bundle protein [Phycisphaerales bacterium]